MGLCNGISLVIKKKRITFGNKYRSMGLWNGISLGINKKHISSGTNSVKRRGFLKRGVMNSNSVSTHVGLVEGWEAD